MNKAIGELGEWILAEMLILTGHLPSSEIFQDQVRLWLHNINN
jgi:hypothetical protein